MATRWNEAEDETRVSWSNDAHAHLMALGYADQVMAALAATYGPPVLVPQGQPYRQLVRAIVGQQLAGKAMLAIFGRLVQRVGDPPTPSGVAACSDDELRACGLSRAKVLSIRDLTERTLDGRLDLENLAALSDAAVIEQLIAVRGIGRWTAEMLLIFGLGRPDVLPVDDYGVRKGVLKAYGLTKLPTSSQVRELATPWRPYATAASLYLWQSLNT